MGLFSFGVSVPKDYRYIVNMSGCARSKTCEGRFLTLDQEMAALDPVVEPLVNDLHTSLLVKIT